jgi:hypothetical protein
MVLLFSLALSSFMTVPPSSTITRHEFSHKRGGRSAYFKIYAGRRATRVILYMALQDLQATSAWQM